VELGLIFGREEGGRKEGWKGKGGVEGFEKEPL